MNTKEAIYFLENNVEDLGMPTPIVNERIKDVIILLKRGEKYEKMFNTILNWTIHDGSFIPVKELINLEQKYFPKLEEGVIK